MVAGGLQMVPRDFSLYWGFGDPLEELDDRELLSKMAHLKEAARNAQPGGSQAPAPTPPSAWASETVECYAAKSYFRCARPPAQHTSVKRVGAVASTYS